MENFYLSAHGYEDLDAQGITYTPSIEIGETYVHPTQPDESQNEEVLGH